MDGLVCSWDAMTIEVVLFRYCSLMVMDLEWQWCVFYQLSSMAFLLCFLHCILDSSLLSVGAHDIFGIQIMCLLVAFLDSL